MTLLFAIALAASPADPVAESLASWVATECQATRVEVVYTGLGVEPPSGAQLVWDGLPCREQPSVRVTVVEGGVPGHSYSLRPRLEIYVLAPVARHDADAGELVLTRPGEVRLSAVSGEPVEGTLIARRTLKAGDPVTTANARPSPDARKGDSVTLFVQSGGLVIEAPGTLQADAAYGEPVKVVNEATRTVLTGVLEEPGRVRIL